MAPLRVCYFVNPGLTRFGIPATRDAILQKALRLHGADVVVCHEDARSLRKVPYLIQDTHPLLPGGLFRRYLHLVRRFLSLPRCDALVVGEQGHALVPLAWLLSKLTRSPLVFDPLFSLYDSSVLDRRVAPPRSGRALLLFLLDLLAFHLPRRLLADTRAHARYYSAAFGVDARKIAVVPVGADEETFSPVPPAPSFSPGRPFRVLFYGTHIPLHGVEHILQAVRLLEDRPDIRFTIIGHFYAEPSYGEVFHALPGLKFRNVELLPEVPYRELAGFIARADLCLGIFGTTSKASRVVPHKAYQALAVGRPLLTGDTPASRELLRHGEDAWLCPPGDGEALARAILHLKDRPEVLERLARGARRAFEERFSARALGRALEEALTKI